MFLKISQNSVENTCSRVSFLIKLQSQAVVKKRDSGKVFSSEFWETFKKTFSTYYFRATASGNNELLPLTTTQEKHDSSELLF